MRARARAFRAVAAATPAELATKLANEDAAAVNTAAPDTSPRARRLARTALPGQRLEVGMVGGMNPIMIRSSADVNEIG